MARSSKDIILEVLELEGRFRKTTEGLDASMREHGRILLEVVANLARLEAGFRGVLPRINENTQRINENTQRINENTQRINENTQRINENTQRINQNTQVINQNTERLNVVGDDSADALGATHVLAAQVSDVATAVRRRMQGAVADIQRLTRLVSTVADLESETRSQANEIDERLTRAEAVIAKLKRG